MKVARDSLRLTGMILLLLPVCVDLIVIVNLAILFQQSEAAKQQLFQIRNCELITNQLISDGWGAGSIANMANPTGTAQIFSQRLENIDRRVNELRKATIGIPRLHEAWEKSHQVLEPGYEKFRQVQELLKQPLSFMLLAELQRAQMELSPLAYSFDHEMKAFLRLTEEVAEEERKHYQSIVSAHIVGILAASIFINFIVTVTFGLFLYHRLIMRLRVIEGNALKLIARQHLSAALPGQDEIARLDHSFHRMADRLSRIQEMRKNFLAVVSHDMRAPLSSVLAGVGLGAHGVYGELPAEAKQVMNRAAGVGWRLNNLIDDLLDWQAFEDGQLHLNCKPFLLSELINAVREAVAPVAEERTVNLAWQDDGSEPKVTADPDRLAHVTINLALACLANLPPASSLTVTFARQGSDLHVIIDCSQVTLSDEAVAILNGSLPQVFADMGLLKLAIGRSIVSAHGGSVLCTSTSTQQITLILPGILLAVR